MTLGTKIVLALILLHLVAGFGWLMYKLGPTGKSSDKEDSSETDE